MSDPNINSTESCKVSLSLGNWPLDFIFAVDGRLMFVIAFFLMIMIAEIWVETKGWQPSVSFCLTMIKIFLLTWILENKTYLKIY